MIHMTFEEYMNRDLWTLGDIHIQKPDCDYCGSKRNEREWNGYVTCKHCGAELRALALVKMDLITGELQEVVVVRS